MLRCHPPLQTGEPPTALPLVFPSLLRVSLISLDLFSVVCIFLLSPCFSFPRPLLPPSGQNVLSCAKLHEALEVLAPQFDHIRFVRVQTTDAMKDYSNVGLPALLIARGGKVLHDFV